MENGLQLEGCGEDLPEMVGRLLSILCLLARIY
jgi:hypothetical protein